MHISSLKTKTQLQAVSTEMVNRGWSKTTKDSKYEFLNLSHCCRWSKYLVDCKWHQPDGGTIPLGGRDSGGRISLVHERTHRTKWFRRRKWNLRLFQLLLRRIVRLQLLRQYYHLVRDSWRVFLVFVISTSCLKHCKFENISWKIQTQLNFNNNSCNPRLTRWR